MAKVSHEKLPSYILACKQIEFLDGKPYWLVSKRGARAGVIAGTLDKAGYRKVYVAGQNLLAHRIAWFLRYGFNPDLSIDHIDGNKDNNSIDNLRLAESYQNQDNMKKPITNTTGFKGVYRNIGRGRPFCAQVKFMGKKYYLGRFDTAEDAKRAYDEMARKLHGDYYRYE